MKLCIPNSFLYLFSVLCVGAAGNTKRPTSCVLVQCKKGAEHEEYYNEVRDEVRKAAPAV